MALVLPLRAPAAAPGDASPATTVIAHRGACGYRPENTLPAYELGARLGAAYLECDLVATRDGALIARHENELSLTTDVAERPELAARRTTKVVDGVPLTGWFTEDLTLAEVRTLRARERNAELRPANAEHDDRHGIPTLQEIVDLARRLSDELEREIGLCIELKHATYFRGIGLPLEEALVAELRRNGLADRRAKVILQAFETGAVRRLAGAVDVPLVQLLKAHSAPYDLVAAGDERTYADLATREGLREIAGYADAVGVAKGLLVPRDELGHSMAPTTLPEDARAAGLGVHVYTFRDETPFVPLELREAPDAAIAELRQFLALGLDAVYADHPDTALEACALAA